MPQSSQETIPPLPAGYTLNEDVPPLPAGYTLNGPGTTPNVSVKLDYNPPSNPAEETPTGVASHQAAEAIKATGLDHPKDLIEHMINAARGFLPGVGAPNELLNEDSINLIKGAITGPLMALWHAPKTVATIIRGSGALGMLEPTPAVPELPGQEKQPTPQFQNPTQGEWEKAARGGMELLQNAPVIAGGVEAARALPGAVGKLTMPTPKPAPIPTLVRALTPPSSMSDFALDSTGNLHLGNGGTGIAASKASTILDELGQYADDTKAPIKTTMDVNKALGERAKVYMDSEDGIAQKILNPRRDITINMAGDKITQARMDAIPKYLMKDNPVEYRRLVRKASSLAGQDMTIGDIDDLRQGMNSKFKDANIRKQLMLDQNSYALDKAAGDAARRLEYDEINKVDPLHGTAFQEANRRLGAIIEGQDLTQGKMNQAISEMQSPFGKTVEKIGNYMRPGGTLQRWGTGISDTINEDLASAVSRWKGRPVEIPLPKTVSKSGTFKPSTIAGTQFDLMPSGSPGAEPLIAPPAGTANTRNTPNGSTIAEDIFRVQQRSGGGTKGSVAEPAPWMPDIQSVKTVKGLEALRAEVVHHIQNDNPPFKTRQQWMKALFDIRDEITNRSTNDLIQRGKWVDIKPKSAGGQ